MAKKKAKLKKQEKIPHEEVKETHRASYEEEPKILEKSKYAEEEMKEETDIEKF